MMTLIHPDLFDALERTGARLVIEPATFDNSQDDESGEYFRWTVGFDTHGSNDWVGALRLSNDWRTALESAVHALEAYESGRFNMGKGKDVWTQESIVRAYWEYKAEWGEEPKRRIYWDQWEARAKKRRDLEERAKVGSYPSARTVMNHFHKWRDLVELAHARRADEIQEDAA